MNQRSAVKLLVVEENRGVVDPGGRRIAGPLAAFARGIVGQSVFSAGAMRFRAGLPDLFQQRVAASEGRFRRGMIAALEKPRIHGKRLVPFAKDVHLEKTSAFWNERCKRLLSSAGDEAIEVAGRPG